VSGTALGSKNREPCLKPEKTKTKHTSHLNTRTGHGPRCGGPRGPPGRPNQRLPRVGSASLECQRFPRVGSASLEGQRFPRVGSASLEGSRHLERVPPRSKDHATSSGFRLARGPTPPSSGIRLARGLMHKRTCSRTRVRAFNALTQQSRAITRLGITLRRCSANSIGETHPRHCRELCDMASASPVTLCRPLPYG
jgi:hypothetical protein